VRFEVEVVAVLLFREDSEIHFDNLENTFCVLCGWNNFSLSVVL